MFNITEQLVVKMRIEYTFHYLTAFRFMYSHTFCCFIVLKNMLAHFTQTITCEAIALCAQRKSAINFLTADCSLRQLGDCS